MFMFNKLPSVNALSDVKSRSFCFSSFVDNNQLLINIEPKEDHSYNEEIATRIYHAVNEFFVRSQDFIFKNRSNDVFIRTAIITFIQSYLETHVNHNIIAKFPCSIVLASYNIKNDFLYTFSLGGGDIIAVKKEDIHYLTGTSYEFINVMSSKAYLEASSKYYIDVESSRKFDKVMIFSRDVLRYFPIDYTIRDAIVKKGDNKIHEIVEKYGINSDVLSIKFKERTSLFRKRCKNN